MKTLKHNNEQNIGELKIGNRILLVDGVSVSFDGFKALNNLSFSIDYGELRCIIGANGAGKSTMMDVVTGKTKPDSGSVIFGEAVDLLSLDEPIIAQIGIGRKFQKPTVFQNHTVFENLELAMKDDKRFFKTLFSKLNSEQKDKIEETMKLIGLKELYNPYKRFETLEKEIKVSKTTNNTISWSETICIAFAFVSLDSILKFKVDTSFHDLYKFFINIL